jgi:ribA/ribD-fused uncharacterized protein
MNRASYFIKNKCLFGSYPTQENVLELENNNVKYFVDLTYSNEKKITKYKTDYTYISYPIIDHQIPSNNLSYAKFIINLCNIIKNDCNENNRVYIHCKGGHGRAGLVVATLLIYILKISPEEGLKLTSQYHSNREVMKEKWRKLGSPQTAEQKNFVYHFTKPIYFFNDVKNQNDSISVLSTFFDCNVKIDNNTFPSAEAAIQYQKLVGDKDYLYKQLNSTSGRMSKLLGERIKTDQNWEKNKYNIAYEILKVKFKTNQAVKAVLLNTKLCKIINRSDDLYWGVDYINSGMNTLGDILYKIREELLLEN